MVVAPLRAGGRQAEPVAQSDPPLEAPPQVTPPPVREPEAPPPPASQPITARIPLEGIEGGASVVIENLTINFQGTPGIVMESDLGDLLQQLLKKGS